MTEITAPEPKLTDPQLSEALLAACKSARESGMNPVTLCATLLGVAVSVGRNEAQASLLDMHTSLDFIWRMAEEYDKLHEPSTESKSP